jgi:hypothetical protein
MDQNENSKFCCSECGYRQLIVSHVWNIEAEINSETWREWGPLKDDHHWQFEFKEKIEKNEDDEVQRGNYGEFAVDDSDSEPEEYEFTDSDLNRESDEYFVNCGDCDREVEFGWSEPDRRGLILPAEFSDFNPLESWADPKYLDSWRQKGWLKAGHTQP